MRFSARRFDRATAGVLPFLALLAAGCGGGETHQQTITTPDGKKIDVTTSKEDEGVTFSAKDENGSVASVTSGGGWPESFGAAAPAYPGAKIGTVVAGQSSENSGGMASFTTSDAPEKVVTFYKERAAAAGMSVEGSYETAGTQLFSARDKTRGTVLSVQVTAGDDGTTAMVTYGGNRH